MESISLKTRDGVALAANFYSTQPDQASSWAVLTHMMPATKESWNELADLLQKNGIASIAVDLRGHGQSEGGPDGYKQFNDAQHQLSIHDLDAAADFLKQRGAAPEKTVFIGASIGANLSLQYIAEHPEFKTAILLSPGLNYRGIETLPSAKNLKSDQRVFFISAKDDARAGGNNAVQNQQLYAAVPEQTKKELAIYENGGHGTEILENKEELKSLIIKFINP